jgi:hypothetical protein
MYRLLSVPTVCICCSCVLCLPFSVLFVLQVTLTLNFTVTSQSHTTPTTCHIFPHYLINDTIFGKTLLNTKRVFWFSLQILSETFVSLLRIRRYVIINSRRSSCKVPAIFSILKDTPIFLIDFPEKFKYQISGKSDQWKQSYFMRTQRQTDRQTWWS